MAGNQGDGSTGTIRCRTGEGHIVHIDRATCEGLLGGHEEPSKTDGGLCSGCGAALAHMAVQFGLADGDVVGLWRQFLERAAKLTPDGRSLMALLVKADHHVVQAIHDDPSTIGDVIQALVAGAEFAQFVLARPGTKADQLSLPMVWYGHFSRSIGGLRKASRNADFHVVLNELEAELNRWKGKSVAEVRVRFFGK